MLAMLKAFLRDESGATAIEYSIIAGGHSACDNHDGQRHRSQAQHDLLVDFESAKIELLVGAKTAPGGHAINAIWPLRLSQSRSRFHQH
jgi:hypothetical protein